jgi:lipoate-protein ligase A
MKLSDIEVALNPMGCLPRLIRCAAPEAPPSGSGFFAGEAAWNMAIDEALLTHASAPVLRFYGWHHPGVTLGRFQDLRKGLNLDVCRQAGVSVARRPTGGRAVFHHTDLTYSLLAPEESVGGRSVMASYRLISAAMAEALANLGVDVVEGALPGPGRQSRADCFAHLAASDLAEHGRKIVGSAQVRRNGWILQQGSIRAWPMNIPEGIFPDQADSDKPASGLVTGYSVSRRLLEDALAGALAGLLDCPWEPAMIYPSEWISASALVRDRYST